ncbi:unnamed protein product [Lathyrus oleraceus]|uniref:Nodule lectin n=1 Tax=Pisum sativum TaxID=3888 RepID=A0A9D5A8M1_PEA|nr:nodule lectin-like [Pisum sativum]KAI5399504.1 Nodule lectin [Pisum sativum]
MAFYRTNLPIQELFSLVSVIFLLLPTNLNSVQALSFNFPKLTPGDSRITLQGDAEILASGVLALTKSSPLPPDTFNPTTGRALYTTPVTLWDNATGDVASFVTSFSFVMETSGGPITDGLIFFIAPPDTVIPINSTTPFLGVVDSQTSINRFVGVEFDLFRNSWDPEGRHIGIDINSIISTKTVRLRWRWVNGLLTKVSIIYDSSSNTLSALVTYESGRISTIAQVVDLKTVLPNIVQIGLSAATLTNQSYNIHSWSFTSNYITRTSRVSDI